MTIRIRSVCLGLTVGLAVLGCSKSKESAAPIAGPAGGAPTPGMPEPGGAASDEVLAKLPGGDEFAAGKKVYATANCTNCHKLGDTGGAKPGGPGGPGGGRGPGGPGGPDLTAVGGNAEHTKQWLADHVRNPKSHKPQSRMPVYGPDKISDADLGSLAEYLASRK